MVPRRVGNCKIADCNLSAAIIVIAGCMGLDVKRGEGSGSYLDELPKEEPLFAFAHTRLAIATTLATYF